MRFEATKATVNPKREELAVTLGVAPALSTRVSFIRKEEREGREKQFTTRKEGRGVDAWTTLSPPCLTASDFGRGGGSWINIEQLWLLSPLTSQQAEGQLIT